MGVTNPLNVPNMETKNIPGIGSVTTNYNITPQMVADMQKAYSNSSNNPSGVSSIGGYNSPYSASNQYNQANPTDYSSYYETLRKSKIQNLQNAAQQQKNALAERKAGIDPRYNASKTQADVQGQISGSRLAQIMANRGYSTGNQAQNMLIQNAQTQGEVSNLEAQRQAEQDQVARNYQNIDTTLASDIEAANSDIDSQKLKALIDEQNRIDELNYSRSRDSVADNQWNKTFDYNKSRDSVADQRYNSETDYSHGRDAVADTRYNSETDYNHNRDAITDQRYTSEYNDKIAQQEVSNAWSRVNLLGYVDDSSSKVLGIPTGTKTQDAISSYAQLTGKMPDGSLTMTAQQYADNKTQDSIANAWDRVNSLGYVDAAASKILNIPTGTQTATAKQQSISNAWAATQAMGYVTPAASKVLGIASGTKTMDAKNALFNQGIDIAQLTGTYRGTKTLEGKQTDYTINKPYYNPNTSSKSSKPISSVVSAAYSDYLSSKDPATWIKENIQHMTDPELKEFMNIINKTPDSNSDY